MAGLCAACLGAAALLGGCAQPEKKAAPPKSTAPVEWYVCGRDPLTYCPRGLKPPPERKPFGRVPSFVYLADRETRFYIPPHAERHREHALQLRELSLQQMPKTPMSVEETMIWVARAAGYTVLGGAVVSVGALAGDYVPPAANAIIEEGMDAVDRLMESQLPMPERN